jgi:hypothetical protein
MPREASSSVKSGLSGNSLTILDIPKSEELTGLIDGPQSQMLYRLFGALVQSPLFRRALRQVTRLPTSRS